VNTGQDITVDIPMRPLPSPTSPTGNDEITITLVNNAQDVSLTNYSPFVLS
jgi:hypothetical protein